MKILITGGGTGGHIHPALAIAHHMSAEADILYVGSKEGMEADIVPAHGIAFKGIDSDRLNKKVSLKTLSALVKVIKGFFQAHACMRSFRPDVVVGTGGYAAGVIVLAATLRGIPTAIHEQNAYPGMTNRLLSGRVNCVMLSFEAARTHLKKPERAVFTGLPVLDAFLSTDRAQAREQLGLTENEILVFASGGSNGAMKLNEVMMRIYSRMREPSAIRFVHVTGRRYYPYVLEDIETGVLPESAVELLPYTDQLHIYLRAADVAVSRAGASTLYEILATQTPAIIVPSPNVANDHQRHNAETIRERGLGVVIEETEGYEVRLEAALRRLCASEDERGALRRSLAQIDVSESTALIATHIRKLAGLPSEDREHRDDSASDMQSK